MRSMDHEALQRSWDAQQEAYVPDREGRFALMLDLATRRTPVPRVLDLAGGTGSITRRLLARHPGATAVVVDTDPVLLAIADATFAGDDRVAVCAADLNDRPGSTPSGPSTPTGRPPASTPCSPPPPSTG